MLKKYIQICNLLDDIGPFQPRLKAVQEMVRSPDFVYQKKSSPHILTDTFARSSYWLDKELFDETCLYANKVDDLTGEQQTHLLMLDIGSDLISKGFPMEYHPNNYNQKGLNQMAHYAKVFMEQCHKRYAFLSSKKITHQKYSFKIHQKNQNF